MSYRGQRVTITKGDVYINLSFTARVLEISVAEAMFTEVTDPIDGVL